MLCVWLVGVPPTVTGKHPRCHDNGNVDDLMEDCSHRHTLYRRSIVCLSYDTFVKPLCQSTWFGCIDVRKKNNFPKEKFMHKMREIMQN